MPPSTQAATTNANCDARGEVNRAALVEIEGTEVDRRFPPDGADAAYYSTLTVIELKDLLRRKGSKVSGKKVNLIERLVSSETKSAKFIDARTDGEEDEALIKEQQRWECPKCQHSNSNDDGYCPKVVEGKRCGGTKQCEKKSWTGCFAQVCDFFSSCFVTSSIFRKD